VVAARVEPLGERAQQRQQEEAHERALAAALAADGVHAVVPVAAAEQRQPVRTDRERALDRTQAVLEQRRALAGSRGPRVDLELARLERRPRQERDRLLEHGLVAGELDVAPGRERQPQHVVGAARARAGSGGLVPPVLDVPFHELAAGGAQQVLAQQRGAHHAERHRVLQLVAEAVGAPGLVVAGASAEAAGQGLVEQPAVQHDVE
jgi:hypothetical protein